MAQKIIATATAAVSASSLIENPGDVMRAMAAFLNTRMNVGNSPLAMLVGAYLGLPLAAAGRDTIRPA